MKTNATNGVERNACSCSLINGDTRRVHCNVFRAQDAELTDLLSRKCCDRDTYIVGTLLAGIFVSGGLGVFSGNGLADGMTIASQLGVQVSGIVVVALFTLVVTAGLLRVVSAVTGGIRVSEEEEQIGLDIVDHDEKGYSL